MLRTISTFAAAAALSLTVAGCAPQAFKTDYAALDAGTTAGWRVRDVSVTVPETLTTSEENSIAPDYDVVWHGEPAGDRRAQVADIVRDGISAGASGLGGKRPVTIVATVSQFHAITPSAERMIAAWGQGGADNIKYTVQVVDSATGAPLTEPQLIDATLPASVSANRPQIVTHIAGVTQNWLGGRGLDQRATFVTYGR